MKNKNMISSNISGTILEWYDFTIYAYLASLLSKLFFPIDDKYTGLILTYSVFAIGFLIRPIGAILFGHIGDKIGRKKALVISIMMMSLPTFLIGLLPTYKQLGLLAPVLLVFLRLIQGLSAGGEVMGSAIFVMESKEENQGFFTSIVWASSGVGILLGSLIVYLVSIFFKHEDLMSFAWRIPFLFGVLAGIVGLYLRLNTTESAEFLAIKHQHKMSSIPFFDLLKRFKRRALKVIRLYSLCAASIYLLFVFMPIYAKKALHLDLNSAVQINTFTMAVMLLLVPFFGHLSDRLGRKRILVFAAVAFILLSYPLFKFISEYGLVGLSIGQLVFAIITAAYQGPMTATVLEALPVEIRYTVAGIGYNVSYAVFGGLAPLAATFLIHLTGNILAPVYYILTGAVISLVSIILY